MVDPKVREWVDKRKRSRIAFFYPTAVAKATGFHLKAVYEQLKELANEGLLTLSYEMRCPNYGCFQTVEGDVCEFCGEDLTEWPEEEVKSPYFRFVREEAANDA